MASSPLSFSLGRASGWALPVALAGGLLSAVQSRINSRLSTELADGFTASAISFGTGLVIVLVIVLSRRSLRERAAAFGHDLRIGALPWPLALGGIGGATFVLGQTFTVALIGVALFIVCVVAGQTVTGLVVDRVGLGPGGVRPLTAPRLIGAGLMVLAVLLAMSSGVGVDVPWPLLVLPVVAGAAMGLQQAVNGRVSQHTGHFMIATLGNFVVGTALLVLVAVVHALAVGHGPAPLPANPVLYLGGAIGVVFIAVAAQLAAPLGVLTLAMTTIAGQIVGSVLLDVLAPTGTEHLTPLTLVGAVLTLVAAAVTAGIGPARRRGAS
ncbi:DMT family transporter [Brachybacterium sp. NPDC056505]|uniref:DMT family transporter n=1 Tax=Brachybacterium sp. NPDC056505 TaxID=3345843 RepID=UPI00366F98AD